MSQWLKPQYVFDRADARKNNEMPISYFSRKDICMLKQFLIKNHFCTNDDLEKLTMCKFKIFLKQMGKTSTQMSDYYKAVDYYNVPAALTKHKFFRYKDIKKRQNIDSEAVKVLIEICQSKFYSKQRENRENKHIVIIRFFQNGKERVEYAKVYDTMFVIGNYNTETQKFVSTGEHKSLKNAEIIEYV